MSESQSSSQPKILIIQRETPGLRSAYQKLTAEYNAVVNFCAATQTKFISLPTFRTYKPIIAQGTAFLFANKISMDCFFSFAKDCSITFPTTTRYFFANNRLKNYLKTYIEIRKRKVFSGVYQLEELFTLFKKHKKEHFVFPCSKERKRNLQDFFAQIGASYHEIPLYSNHFCPLDNVVPNQYDLIVFFTPRSVASFAQSFPQYQWNPTQLAVFGEKTAEAAQALGWSIRLRVPNPEISSMIYGLQHLLRSGFPAIDEVHQKQCNAQR